MRERNERETEKESNTKKKNKRKKLFVYSKLYTITKKERKKITKKITKKTPYLCQNPFFSKKSYFDTMYSPHKNFEPRRPKITQIKTKSPQKPKPTLQSKTTPMDVANHDNIILHPHHNPIPYPHPRGGVFQTSNSLARENNHFNSPKHNPINSQISYISNQYPQNPRDCILRA